MTLTIHTEEDEQRQLTLTVEVEESRVEKSMRKIARNLAREIRVPGFRPGKAPYRVLVKRIGRDNLRAEAVDNMVQEVYEEALAQADVQNIYAQPALQDMTIEPLVLSFLIPLEPVVKLGDYRSMRREIEPVAISDEAVDEAMERIQNQHEILEEVDRPVEAGDKVTLSGEGYLLPTDEDEEDEDADFDEEEAAAAEAEAEATDEEFEEVEPEEVSDDEEEYLDDDFDDDEDEFFDDDDEYFDDDEDEFFDDDDEYFDDDDEDELDYIFDEEQIDLIMDADQTFANTPFVDHILGMSAGEEKEFQFTFPADYEDASLAGRTVEFDIEVLNVKRRELPPMDDELAKLEGRYETLEELRQALREELEEAAQEEAMNELIESMVDDLKEDAEVVYPPAAVKLETDDMIEGFKQQVQRAGWEWDDYLMIQGGDEENIREDFRESAEERVVRGLLLRQFVLEEKLKVEEEDVEAIIDKRVQRFDQEELREGMRDYYRQGQGFQMISSEVLQKKVYERVQDILSGMAPDLNALEEEEEAGEVEETAVADEEETEEAEQEAGTAVASDEEPEEDAVE